MPESVKVCPKCHGEKGFGVKGSFGGWSICWTCGGRGVVPK